MITIQCVVEMRMKRMRTYVLLRTSSPGRCGDAMYRSIFVSYCVLNEKKRNRQPKLIFRRGLNKNQLKVTVREKHGVHMYATFHSVY